jgi:hypothetical protein
MVRPGLVAVLVVLLATACDADPERSPAPPPSPPPTTSVEPPVNLAAWVESLPQGKPPAVPYAVGTTLHLPGGVRVPIDGTSVEIVGATRRGTMLLVERYDPTFDTDHVWVTPNGTTRVLPDTRSHGVQDAAVSPDGRWFASGGEVVDLADGSLVAQIPDRAVIVTGWVRDGLVYGTRDNRVWIWPPGGAGYPVHTWVSFPNRTQVGLTQRAGCWRVIHMYSYDDVGVSRRRCGGANPLTVSPRGSWVLTRDLAVRDAFSRPHGYLAGQPVRPVGAPLTTYWVSDREMLLALPYGLVRCDARTLDCERVRRGEVELPVR